MITLDNVIDLATQPVKSLRTKNWFSLKLGKKRKMTSPFNFTGISDSLLEVSTSYYKSNINVTYNFRWVNTERNVWKTLLRSDFLNVKEAIA